MPRISETPGKSGFAGVYSHCPELLEAFHIQYAVSWEYGTVSPLIKELCRLKSAYLNACNH